MNNTINNNIQTYVIEPLNQMFDGELSEVSLDYKVSISYMDWLRKHDRWYDVEEAQRVNLYTVRGMVDFCRECGYAEELAMALTPLYLELLTAPADRMCFEGNMWGEDERRNRRWEATDRLRQIMGKEEHFAPLFERIEPLTLLERCIEVTEKKEVGNFHWQLYLRALAYAALNGVSVDWDALYAKVKPELVNRPANCIMTKVEYCCLTIAVVMIMQDERLDRDGREQLLQQVAEANVWYYALFDFYSVLLDLPLHANYTNVIQIVNRFIANKNRMPYTHLLKDCIRYNPNLLEVPEGDTKKQVKRKKTEEKLQKALRDQSDELDALFSVLFPKVKMAEYSRDSHRLTTGEIQRSLQQQQEHNKVLAKQINEMQVEISTLRAFREAAEQYGDSVSIADLREMLERIDYPEEAQQLYMYLDFHLSENESWGKHTKELKSVITEKFAAKRERERRLLEAASKPTTVTNNFYKDSCNFGAGSSMFGDVSMKEKSNNQKDKTK